MILNYRLQGIPCKVKVLRFEEHEPSGETAQNAPSDIDYYGCVEIEYAILDRRGYAAPWLERKITERDDDDIQKVIKEAYC